ncbi:hypothetical protein [Salinibacterium sp.]|uniref:hypothetical protein n=1 Tax=Salinibacterium sp. TaxID=1915057 RepID=UPI00286A971F|nr:hypothetical protein [Salinibacterium sp.]
MSDATPDPFAAYHLAGRRMTVARVIPTAIAALAIATGLGYLTASTPPAPAAATQDSTAPAPADASVIAPAAALPLPAEASATAALAAPPTLAATGQPRWSIDIDTVGYQPEIDACHWVRMDLGLYAPLVGAHNYCGGDIVLGMAIGDSVTLAGVGLDGDYTVTAVRDAVAGDNARRATDGLGGSVILQTCYWGSDGREKLVALALG